MWIDRDIWKDAVMANILEIASEEQLRILEAGHWLAK